MTGRHRGSARLSAAGLVSSLALSTCLSGCGAAAARADLGQAVEDTSAAVQSVVLVVDLLQQQQTTRAAAEVTAQDMTDQIASAQTQLAAVPGPTAEVRALRTQVQVAVAQSLVAVQQVADDLAAGTDPGEAAAELAEAQQTLRETSTAVGER